jgi:Ca2+-binding EF-hand superfamily protein
MNEFNRKWTDEVVEDFARFDANRDGLITSRECLAAVKKGFIPGAISSTPSTSTSADSTSASPAASASAAKPSFAAPASERMRSWAESKIKKIDKDGNKTLSPDEFTEGDFNQVDVNKDGKIDLDEYVQFRDKKK